MKMIKIRYSDETIPIGKILCLGRNYPEHAKEMNSEVPEDPIIFLKPSTAVIHDGEPIVLPSISNELHHEVELVVALGRDGKNVPSHEAEHHILGYGVGLDMTLRDIQNAAKKKGLPWSIAKGFDTSAPVSDIIPKERLGDRARLRLRCAVNGVTRQDASISEMIFTPAEIIAYASSLFTLERGDLIFTGTPHCVGKVVPGDTIDAELVGHLKISHRVIAA